MAAGIGAVLLIGAALHQAETARRRHREQTKADLQRRITESFSKATEQLGSDKIEVRLGGIYTLERISRESLDDYWTAMETLCAFVRERAPWKESDIRVSDNETDARSFKSLPPIEPPTDIGAVLAVLARRPKAAREREKRERLSLDLRATDLQGSRP